MARIMSAAFAWPAVGFVALLALAPLLSRRVCRAIGRVKPNFRGDPIPASVGITFLIVTAATYGALALGGGRTPVAERAPVFLLVALGFGLLGLADDLWGTRAVGGFRGHVGALLRLRPTTGGIKLVGGGLIALLAGWLLRGPRPEFVLDALIIALAANALNLLDVRPGRALAGFGLLALPTLALVALRGNGPGGVLLLAAVFVALAEWPDDAGGRAMMGDTGSNLLGALAALAAVIEMPIWGRAVLFVLLLTLNAAAERFSLSRKIAETPWLAAIDRRLGVR